MLFFGTQMGITGFQFNVQPICQMLAGYMFPGRPLANFYFTCYTYNTLQQGELLARDLKLAAVRPLATAMHLPGPVYRLRCRCNIQLGHDDIHCTKPGPDPQSYPRHEHLVRTEHPAVQHLSHRVVYRGRYVLGRCTVRMGYTRIPRRFRSAGSVLRCSSIHRLEISSRTSIGR